jgi:RNA polymerase sigma-70 factor, ECF subfamily
VAVSERVASWVVARSVVARTANSTARSVARRHECVVARTANSTARSVARGYAWPCYGRVGMQPSLEQVSFAELVERETRGGGAGDRAVESEICRRFAPRIRLYGLKHLRDEDRARELVQLVLVAVIEALRGGRVEEPQHLERFVLGVCRHVSGRLRLQDGRAQPTDATQLELLGGVHVPAVDAVDAAPLLDCIGKLEKRAQTVLHLAFYRDKTADEIAAALGTTPGNVRVLRHRAIAQVRDCMEAHA